MSLVKKPTQAEYVTYCPHSDMEKNLKLEASMARNTKLSKCLSIQIVQWLFLKKVLPLRLNLILVLRVLDRDPS